MWKDDGNALPEHESYRLNEEFVGVNNEIPESLTNVDLFFFFVIVVVIVILLHMTPPGDTLGYEPNV